MLYVTLAARYTSSIPHVGRGNHDRGTVLAPIILDNDLFNQGRGTIASNGGRPDAEPDG